VVYIEVERSLGMSERGSRYWIERRAEDALAEALNCGALPEGTRRAIRKALDDLSDHCFKQSLSAGEGTCSYCALAGYHADEDCPEGPDTDTLSPSRSSLSCAHGTVTALAEALIRKPAIRCDRCDRGANELTHGLCNVCHVDTCERCETGGSEDGGRAGVFCPDASLRCRSCHEASEASWRRDLPQAAWSVVDGEEFSPTKCDVCGESVWVPGEAGSLAALRDRLAVKLGEVRLGWWLPGLEQTGGMNVALRLTDEFGGDSFILITVDEEMDGVDHFVVGLYTEEGYENGDVTECEDGVAAGDVADLLVRWGTQYDWHFEIRG
jgi:hypothetical protein